MERIAIKRAPRRATVNVHGRQYRIEEGAEHIELPADDAAVFRAVYAYLLVDAPAPRPAAKKKAVADAADKSAHGVEELGE